MQGNASKKVHTQEIKRSGRKRSGGGANPFDVIEGEGKATCFLSRYLHRLEKESERRKATHSHTYVDFIEVERCRSRPNKSFTPARRRGGFQMD